MDRLEENLLTSFYVIYKTDVSIPLMRKPKIKKRNIICIRYVTEGE